MTQEKIEHWKKLIASQKASGLTIIAWCQKHNSTETAYHYWRRQINKYNAGSDDSEILFAEVIAPQSNHAQVPISSDTSLHLKWKDLSISITTEEEARLAAALLKPLLALC